MEAASRHTLSKGPRGGGRILTKIIQHVRDVDASYLTSLGGKLRPSNEDEPREILTPICQAILITLIAAVRVEVLTHGPRGVVDPRPHAHVLRLQRRRHARAMQSAGHPGGDDRVPAGTDRRGLTRRLAWMFARESGITSRPALATAGILCESLPIVRPARR